MRIAVAVVYTPNWLPLAQLVLPNLFEYCGRHGYTLVTRIESVPYNGFSKFTLINNLFKVQKYDVVFSMDLDTLVTNHNIKIEGFLDGGSFYICRDLNGINCGTFILCNTKWSRVFISSCLTREGKRDCEQNAVDEYMAICNDAFYYNDQNITILPHPSINSYPYDYYAPYWGKIGAKDGDVIPRPSHEEGDWREHDFVCHVPGHTLEKRIEILNSLKIIK